MKITIVMGFFLPMPPAAGGATEKSWHQLALEFVRRGHQVTIVSRQWKGWPDQELRDGVNHLRLRGYSHTRHLIRNLWRDLLWSLRVNHALPVADITIVNSVALPIWLGWWRQTAGRLVVMPGRIPKGQYRFYRRVDRVLAVSTPVRAAVIAENPRLASVTQLLGYPIDWGTLAQPRSTPRHDESVTIGFVGRIHREKGLDLLVAALGELAKKENLPAWRVVLCGPQTIEEGGSGDAYAHALRQTLAAKLPAGTWELHPPLFSREQLAQVYRRLDVFCYPSLAARGETFGVAVVEAMAAGAVPVVSDLECFSDYLRPGENGEQFDPSAPDAAIRLGTILEKLITHPEQRVRLAHEAQATARRYDFPAFAERLLADFSTLKSATESL